MEEYQKKKKKKNEEEEKDAKKRGEGGFLKIEIIKKCLFIRIYNNVIFYNK